MKRIILFAIVLISTTIYSQQSAGISDNKTEVEAVKKVILESYIEAIYIKADTNLIKKGWHPEAAISMLQPNGTLVKLTTKFWIDTFRKNPKPYDPEVKYEFTEVKVTGTAAIVIMEIYHGEKHIYTDYMNMYKFKDGWKIASKTWYSYPKTQTPAK